MYLLLLDTDLSNSNKTQIHLPSTKIGINDRKIIYFEYNFIKLIKYNKYKKHL